MLPEKMHLLPTKTHILKMSFDFFTQAVINVPGQCTALMIDGAGLEDALEARLFRPRHPSCMNKHGSSSVQHAFLFFGVLTAAVPLVGHSNGQGSNHSNRI